MAARSDSIRVADEVVFFSDDLVFKILSWLPVISLLRFKSVCKSWKAIIQSPDFVDEHLRHRQLRLHDQALLRLHVRYGLPDLDFTSFYLLQGQDFQVSSRIDSPPGLNRPVWDMNMFSCNGLICVMHGDPTLDKSNEDRVFNFLLWNPATKQSRVLAQPEFGGRYPLVGFGCDVLTNDYKIVLLYIDKTDPTRKHCKMVYSLIKDSWSYAPLEDDVYICNLQATYWNGSCLWIKFSGNKMHCLSFNLGDEEFYNRPLPDSWRENSMAFPKLVILGDTVACFIEVRLRAGEIMYQVWMLNENGANEDWTKVYIVGPFLFRVKPITFLNDCEFLLFMNQQLCIHNLVTEETKNLPREGNSDRFIGAVQYLDSLVSVEGRIH